MFTVLTSVGLRVSSCFGHEKDPIGAWGDVEHGRDEEPAHMTTRENSDPSLPIVRPDARTRSRVVRKSLNPLLWQTWVFGWYLICGLRYKLADRVNARSGWLARRIRWPWAWEAPTAGLKCMFFGLVGLATR